MKENIRYFWLRDKNNHPVGCVASARIIQHECALSPNFPEQLIEYVAFTVSSLNPKDQWDWELGKQIAINRLERQLEYRWMVKHMVRASNPVKGSVKQRIMEIISNSLLPFGARAKEAAEYWLSEEAELKRNRARRKDVNSGR